MRTRFGAVLAFVACLLGDAGSAVAQPSDEPARAAATALGQAGIDDLRYERWAEGLEKLERAYAIVRAPTLGLWSARAMVKLGRWVEASERLREVGELPETEGNPEVQAQAKRDAAEDHETLRPRIPKLKIVVSGSSNGVSVALDGRDVDTKLLGVDQLVDPGEHEIVARRGEQKVTRTATLSEGETHVVELVLEPEKVDAPVAEVPPPVVPPPPRPSDATKPDASSGGSASMHRASGWIALGLGGAGLVAGTAARVVALGRKDRLEPFCDGDVCAYERRHDVGRYNRARVASDVGYGIGVLGVGLGAVLLFTVPSEDSDDARTEAWIGPAGGGMRGVF